MSRKSVGAKGEGEAVELLRRKGWKIRKRNWRCKFGEIDVVAEDPFGGGGQRRTLVFVEVKTKTGDKFGSPWEMVGRWKVKQVKRMGGLYVREYGWEGLARVDVVGVVLDWEGNVEEIEHWEAVE